MLTDRRRNSARERARERERDHTIARQGAKQDDTAERTR